MTVSATLPPPPIFRAFDANGAPLAGGKLYSYQSGTLIPQATYSDATGTPNTNPVILDANGQALVYLDVSLVYDLLLKDADDVTQPDWPRTGITGTATQGDLLAALANTSDVTKGDALIGVKGHFTGATARTQDDRNMDFVNVMDYLTTAQITDVRSGAHTLDVTAPLQAALTAAGQFGRVLLPPGTYKVTGLTMTGGTLIGESSANTILYAESGDVLTINEGEFVSIRHLKVIGNGGAEGAGATNGAGIVINGCNVFELADVICNHNGSHGLYITGAGGALGGSYIGRVSNCTFGNNKGSGVRCIYTAYGDEKNIIEWQNCNIVGNFVNGMDLWGFALHVHDCTIEGHQHGWGIKVAGDLATGDDPWTRIMDLSCNYFERNDNGHILIKPVVAHNRYVDGLVISRNFFTTDTSEVNPGAIADIEVQDATGTRAAPGVRRLSIRDNKHNIGGALIATWLYGSLGGALGPDSVVEWSTPALAGALNDDRPFWELWGALGDARAITRSATTLQGPLCRVAGSIVWSGLESSDTISSYPADATFAMQIPLGKPILGAAIHVTTADTSYNVAFAFKARGVSEASYTTKLTVTVSGNGTGVISTPALADPLRVDPNDSDWLLTITLTNISGNATIGNPIVYHG